MKVIFDLPDGLTEADIPDLKAAITHWAKKRVEKQDNSNKRPKKPALNMREVRAGFILRGDTVFQWAVRNGYNGVHVLRSVRGDYNGPKAKRVISELKAELGL